MAEFIYVLEYYGGQYSDAWTAVQGAFSSPEKAMEWCRANPNREASYGEEYVEENFTIYTMKLDDPEWKEDPPREREFFHRPEIVKGVQVLVTGYAPNAKPERQALLHQIGTVDYRNYKNVGVKFDGSKRVWPFSVEYLEKLNG